MDLLVAISHVYMTTEKLRSQTNLQNRLLVSDGSVWSQAVDNYRLLILSVSFLFLHLKSLAITVN